MTATIESNGYINPAELFKPIARDYVDVEIEELGKFRIRTITAGEAAEYAADRLTKNGELRRSGIVSSNARIIVLCCVNENGDRIFSRDDVHKLQELPAGPVAKLAIACLEHCNLNDDEDEIKN